jgi:hypothetical protein
MSTPDAIKYEMTHAVGGALPSSSAPAYLRTSRAPSAPTAAAGPMFEPGPTTRAAIWMCRRGNRRWGLPLALMSAIAYVGAAWFFYELHHMIAWVFVALFAYNAVKFTLVATWLIIVNTRDLLGAAVGRPRAASPVTE